MCVLALSFIALLLNVTIAESKLESRVHGSSRIYALGGRLVELQEFPFIVFIIISAGSCSGSIPSPTTILTSAVHEMEHATAYAGIVDEQHMPSHHAQIRNISRCVEYSSLMTHDIRICYVETPWVWTPYVQPVNILLKQFVLPVSFVKVCQVVGFGKGIEENDSVVARVMNQVMCSALNCLHSVGSRYLHTHAMCSINVINKTICRGDEGGPVVCTENGVTKQWGVTNTMSPPDSVCRLPMDVNMYTFTPYYRDWILENIKDLPSKSSRATVSQKSDTIIKICMAMLTIL